MVSVASTNGLAGLAFSVGVVVTFPVWLLSVPSDNIIAVDRMKPRYARKGQCFSSLCCFGTNNRARALECNSVR